MKFFIFTLIIPLLIVTGYFLSMELLNTYNTLNRSEPMIRQGPFLLNDTAAADPACQAAMASYLKQLQAEEVRREAIRSGRAPVGQWTTWNVSDRD